MPTWSSVCMKLIGVFMEERDLWGGGKWTVMQSQHRQLVPSGAQGLFWNTLLQGQKTGLLPRHPPVIGCGLTLADGCLQVRAIPKRGSPECCQPPTLPALGGGMRGPAWAGTLWHPLPALNKWSSFSLLMDINRSAYSLDRLVADLHPGPCPDLVGTCNIQVFGHSTHLDGWEQTFIDSQARGMGWDWHY